jgi:hypothetical protein
MMPVGQGKGTADLNRTDVTVAGMMAVAMMVTMSCSCPLVSFIVPAPKVTPTPTKTPRPSFTSTPAHTPTPVETPTPTATDTPTEIPTPAVTDTPTFTPVPPTPTRRPPTATATRRPRTPTPRPPTATPTPRYQYSLRSKDCRPDTETALEGTIWDSDLTQQVAGVYLKVCIAGEWWCDERGWATPYYPGQSDGEYLVHLWDAPKEGSWFVQVVDANGNALSEAVFFETTLSSAPGDCQWVTIDFKKNH